MWEDAGGMFDLVTSMWFNHLIGISWYLFRKAARIPLASSYGNMSSYKTLLTLLKFL